MFNLILCLIEYNIILNVVKSTRVDPQHLPATLGQKADFFCTSKYNVTWYYNDKVISNNTEIYTSTMPWIHSLTINKVELKHTGTYVCLGQEDTHLLLESKGVLYINCKFNDNE